MLVLLETLQAWLGQKGVLFALRCQSMRLKVLFCLNLNAVISCNFCIFLRIFIISDQVWFRIYILFWLIGGGCENIVRNNLWRLALIGRFRTALFDEIYEVLSLQQGKLILNHADLLLKAPEQGRAAHLLKPRILRRNASRLWRDLKSLIHLGQLCSRRGWWQASARLII